MRSTREQSKNKTRCFCSLGRILGGAIVLGVGIAVYGVTAPERPLHALGWFAVGLACFISIGITLGTVLRTSRAATAIGTCCSSPSSASAGAHLAP